MSIKLTKTVVDSAEIKEKRYSLWDSQLVGFGLRVYTSGRKMFIFDYRQHGRKRRYTIGQHGSISLSEARREAQKLAGQVARGEDPQTEKDAARRSVTVSDFCDEYLAKHSKVNKKSWKQDEYRFRRTIKPEWGNRRLDSITPTDAQTLFNKVSQRAPTEANNVRRLISSLFTKASEWGILDFGASNPARFIKLNRDRIRDRFVTYEEMPRLLAAIDGQPDVYVRTYFKLLLLTGCRRSELLSARWDQLDLVKGHLSLPDTKAGRSFVVPLSEVAVKLVRELPRYIDNPHLFPGRKAGESRKDVKDVWNKIRAEAELEDVRIHDLRRTTGSWLGMMGSNDNMIRSVLNHTTDKAAKRYQHMGQDVRRKVMDRLAEDVLRHRD